MSSKTNISNKEVRKLVREMEERGWVVVRFTGTGHIKMKFTNGGTTIFPVTPSDGRWLKNKHAEVKRIEEGRFIAYGQHPQ